LADVSEDLNGADHLRGFCRTVEVEYLNPVMGKFRSIAALFSSQPLTMSYFFSSKLKRKVKEAVKRLSVDVAVAYSSGMIPYLIDLDVPLVVDFVDLDSQKWLQYARTTRPPLKWIYALEGRRLFNYELMASGRAKTSIVVTREEGRVLAERDGSMDLRAIPMGVDFDYYKLDIPPEPSLAGEHRPVLIFVGAMDYMPNCEAVVRFADKVFPLVSEQIPDALFLVVGSNPSSKVRSLHNGKSIIVTGTVPDARPYLRAATTAVIPLSIARGIQTKILEAMSMELPVVLTGQAARGISAKPGRDYLVVDSDREMASKIVELWRDPARARKIACAGQEFVKKHFAWDDKLIEYERILEEAAGGRE